MAVQMQILAQENKVVRSATSKEQRKRALDTRNAALLSMAQSDGGAAARGRNEPIRGGASSSSRGRGGGRPRGGGVDRASSVTGRGSGASGRGGVRGGTSSRSRGPPAGSRSSIAPSHARSQGSVTGPAGQQPQASSGCGDEDIFDLASTNQSDDGEPEWSEASADGGLDADVHNAVQAAAYGAEATALSGCALGRQQRGGDGGSGGAAELFAGVLQRTMDAVLTRSSKACSPSQSAKRLPSWMRHPRAGLPGAGVLLELVRRKFPRGRGEIERKMK